jgi:hypothetical protein
MVWLKKPGRGGRALDLRKLFNSFFNFYGSSHLLCDPKLVLTLTAYNFHFFFSSKPFDQVDLFSPFSRFLFEMYSRSPVSCGVGYNMKRSSVSLSAF